MALGSASGALQGLLDGEPGFPGPLSWLIAEGPAALRAAGERLAKAPAIDPAAIEWLPPLPAPGKIICVGLNYVDHSLESGFVPPTYPTIFVRFSSSMIGHGAPIRRPAASVRLDYEGEMVAVIGKAGRHIDRSQALDHVVGYSVFNDASIRDFQTKSPQWTIGKNFDDTGPFGPFMVTADELPAGGKGLHIQTRLNGQTVQDASTDDMIFDVAALISILSEAITLWPGDIIVSGTPSGVGMARKPPLFMKHGDVCEVEIEGIGILRNPVADEIGAASARKALANV
ncbi:fumarylacetoacetate hydrolase family protein [Hypericibacter sp.]|uniref:fumarylacetoacetate hydrolase family protein n=1 Tax=Hypericibacter sp. TaxID=2705401 RepID=UPI003D6CE138